MDDIMKKCICLYVIISVSFISSLFLSARGSSSFLPEKQGGALMGVAQKGTYLSGVSIEVVALSPSGVIGEKIQILRYLMIGYYLTIWFITSTKDKQERVRR